MWSTFLYWLYGGQLYLAVVATFSALAAVDLFSGFDNYPPAKRTAGFLALLALPLAVFCAPPVPLWFAFLLLTVGSLYLFAGFGKQGSRRSLLAVGAIVGCAAAIVIELPYQLSRGHVPRPSKLFVIGNSLASGGFEERQPWPELLASRARVPVTNLALASADAQMALEREVPLLPRPGDSNECVLIEIGANDMFDGIPLEQFESALDRLLELAGSKGGRRLVMLELPLLPGRWAYGAVQRRLARKYGCTVVPKRLLAKAQLAEGGTSDGAHLTQQGHDEFARALCTWLAWDVRA